MKQLNVMIKPASSLCDMRCGYCFYNDVSAHRSSASLGIMTRDTAAKLIENVFSVLTAGDRITFAFQGGEPGLAGLDFFMFFAAEVKKYDATRAVVSYAMQTNGLMLDEKWCAFLKEHNFLVGLSLDGDMALHNRNRMDAQGKGTFNRVMDAKKQMDTHGVAYNILCVLTKETARRAKRIWDFIIKEKIQHIQFIPCLEPLNGNSPMALVGDRFHQFYATLFPLWKAEALKGNIVSIRLFEDLALLLLGGQPVTCGISGRCYPQIIVEADGGVYPCDFYVLDEYRVSDLSQHNLQTAFEAVVNSGFANVARQTSASCAECTHRRWCNGGCKRMVNAMYGNPCGMKLFLDECLQDLLQTCDVLRRRRHI